MTKVVLSVPFDGPTGKLGHQAAHAVKTALHDAESPVELVVLDAGAGPFGEHVAANARRAAGDDEVVAYLGEFHSAATEVSLPILEAAGVPHVSFSNTLRRLVGHSFVSVMPNDERHTAGLVNWMLELGVKSPFLLDDGEDYGIDMRWLVHRAISACGRRVAGAHRLFDGDTDLPEQVAEADAVFLGTYARPWAAEVLREVRALAPDALLFGTDGLLTADLAGDAPDGLHVSAPAGPSKEMRARLGEDVDVYATYAYEAMAVVLDALEETGPGRQGIVAHLRSITDRHSKIGRYGFDEHGASTLSAISRFVTRGGRFEPA